MSTPTSMVCVATTMSGLGKLARRIGWPVRIGSSSLREIVAVDRRAQDR